MGHVSMVIRGFLVMLVILAPTNASAKDVTHPLLILANGVKADFEEKISCIKSAYESRVSKSPGMLRAEFNSCLGTKNFDRRDAVRQLADSNEDVYMYAVMSAKNIAIKWRPIIEKRLNLEENDSTAREIIRKQIEFVWDYIEDTLMAPVGIQPHVQQSSD